MLNVPVCFEEKNGIWKYNRHQAGTLLVIQKLPEKNLSCFHVKMTATAAK